MRELFLGWGLVMTAAGASLWANTTRSHGVRVAEATDTGLCRRLLPTGHRSEPQPPAEAVTEFPDPEPDADVLAAYDVAGLTREQFDLNNDGAPDIVLGLHPRTHAQSGDVYFGYDASGLKRFKASAGNMDDLIANARAVIPFGWSGCCPGKHYDPYADHDFLDAELPLTTPRSSGKAVAWRARYLHVTPFVLAGTTYLLLATDDVDRAATSYLVRPTLEDRFEVVCRFEKGGR